MKNYLLFLLLISALFFACEKESIEKSGGTEELNASESFIFGLTYGFCLGDACVRLFKLEGGELYAEEGLERLQLDQEIPFLPTPLSSADYEKALPLLNDFPELLTNQTDTIYGIPDAHDQGGIYIELKTDEDSRFWLLDTRTERLPEVIQAYADRMIDITNELSEE